MNQKTKLILLVATFANGIVGILANVQVAIAGGQGEHKDVAASAEWGKPIPLKEAKLNIEHNARDEDTGFQGFLDSEGWNVITVTGPDGKVLEIRGEGKLGELGLTELFFESVEPENAVVPIDDVLGTLPEGKYKFEGTAIENGVIQGKTSGTALLTHDIPEGPELVTPLEDAVVSAERVFW